MIARRAERLDRLARGEVPRGGDVVEVDGELVAIDETEELQDLEEETPGLAECLRIFGFIERHGLGMVAEYLYPISPEALEACDVIRAGLDEEGRAIQAERAGEKK